MFRPSSERYGSAVALVAVAATPFALPRPADAHRQHSARQARFIQRDPLADWGPRVRLATAEPNPYGYVHSSPVTFADPEGLLAIANPGEIGPIPIIDYGNFCGPLNPPSGPEPTCAIDCMDSACCIHDEC